MVTSIKKTITRVEHSATIKYSEILEKFNIPADAKVVYYKPSLVGATLVGDTTNGFPCNDQLIVTWFTEEADYDKPTDSNADTESKANPSIDQTE